MKKKIISIVIVLVVLLGAAAFVFRDMISAWFVNTFGGGCKDCQAYGHSDHINWTEADGTKGQLTEIP